MATTASQLAVSAGHRPGRRILVLDEGTGLTQRPVRWWDRVGTRLRAFSLDSQLGAGRAPEADLRLAIRAQVLVDPSTRGRLARDWGHLVDIALDDAKWHPSQAPVCRGRVAAVIPAITELVAGLRSPSPVPVRGVAIASRLLADGSGPVYDRRCQQSLGSVIDEAIRHLDPSAALLV